MMDAVGTFETPVKFYQIAWHNIPKDGNLKLIDSLQWRFVT